MKITIRSARLFGSVSLGALAAVGWAGMAHAQQAVDPSDAVVITGDRYQPKTTTSATKTETPLVDVPQAVTVVTQAEIEDRAAQNLADVVRYVPGVSFAQGEGNRDTPIFRGNASTADMFVDGIRDDVQYFRDLYNIERVDVLKGPNGMIFGRGGGGGILNRVTRQANGQTIREIGIQASSEGGGRITGDFGQRIDDMLSVRVTGVAEDSDSFRDDVSFKRLGINPTVQVELGEQSTLRVGYEYYDYEFVADRGITAFQGKPIDVDPATFFGDPSRSPTTGTVNAITAAVDHTFSNGMKLSNKFRYGDYKKFYQNVYASGIATTGGTIVPIGAYNQGTDRGSVFNQTDLTFSAMTGGIKHNFLLGAELGTQHTDNTRLTGYFTDVGINATSANVPVANPRYAGTIAFRQSATDADNHSEASQAALYVQDQIEFSPQWQALLGVRYDRFDAKLRNNRNGVNISSEDDLIAPRAALIFKPMKEMSFYASYAQTFVPRAGDQLASLTATNAALDPEEWENIEVGAKWDVFPFLSATGAVYQLDRTNVAITDPLDSTRLILVEGQRVSGVELGLTGDITDAWSVAGGYAYQDSEILSNQSAAVQAGARLAQTPEHSFSLWNRYDFNDAWGAGLGVIYVAERFAGTENILTPASNTVMDEYVRVDAAVFWKLNQNFRLQLNVENLLDEDYYVNAHSTSNISPGSPRSFRVGLVSNF